ncbi:hypothetical protein THF1D04_11014 [Vibrio owensii]|uniref:Uncharacterized protein n=1 Tax=Vibrio owensii TaxID=696485 RepID=A0AAU9Q0F7_9VIBR|nr:hypothetical protein THF1D04_11014 [Vibrio owensii]
MLRALYFKVYKKLETTAYGVLYYAENRLDPRRDECDSTAS